MNRRIIGMVSIATAIASAACGAKPNLLIIQTDEHNFRTLGCYRALMSEEQAFVWGKGVKVDTPNLDRLAREGAICTSFYAASPVCTPSRASFVTGLYPVATGAPRNDMPMRDGMATFATVLQDAGYATAYVGKWHLDGEAKPGFGPPRKFGFADNRYMMNRGHWKGLERVDGKPAVIGLVPEKEIQKFNVSKATPEDFTTDFLASRTVEILERDKGGPFCVMLSIPDPHGPNGVRPPYDTMFDDLHFSEPRTMEVSMETMPKWAVNKELVDRLDQADMQDYFGMVKCIDDNVGRLLEFLDDNGLAENTIVVFTSDHGDLMGEHRRHNKGMPYEASAKIPFVVRWPARIPAGKVVNTAYTTADFTPTLLGLMGAPQIPGVHGLNDSKAFLSTDKVVESDRITYMTIGGWVAAVNDRYKYVLSSKEQPWLFDLERDPDELTNCATNPEYASVVDAMETELVRQMKQFKEPLLEAGIIYSQKRNP